MNRHIGRPVRLFRQATASRPQAPRLQAVGLVPFIALQAVAAAGLDVCRSADKRVQLKVEQFV